jgi:hypothetical protein
MIIDFYEYENSSKELGKKATLKVSELLISIKSKKYIGNRIRKAQQQMEEEEFLMK